MRVARHCAYAHKVNYIPTVNMYQISSQLQHLSFSEGQ